MPRVLLLFGLLGASCDASAEATPTCASSRDCAAGLVCSWETGRCGAPALPDAGAPPIPCAADSECSSGLCSQGLCACTRDGWAGWASGVLSERCAGCHGWATNLDSARDVSRKLRVNLESNAMPPSQGLPQEERDRLLRWIDCGLPP